jgi:hypothetical protein
MMKYILTLALAASVTLGCAGTTTAIQKRNLDVENKMSSTIFLEPAAPEDRTIFVQVRNTSDNAAFNIENNVIQSLRSRGYLVTNDPKKANYMLQANVLSVGQIDKATRDQMAEQGFGGALGGGLVGGGIGALASGHSDAMIIGALAGAAVGTILNTSFQDVTYSVITDVQVSERVKGKIASKTQTTLAQGTSSKTTSTSTKSSEWERYQTRVVSTANKSNLKLEEATPALVDGVSAAVAGIF